MTLNLDLMGMHDPIIDISIGRRKDMGVRNIMVAFNYIIRSLRVFLCTMPASRTLIQVRLTILFSRPTNQTPPQDL
jgi:hypothetical protein